MRRKAGLAPDGLQGAAFSATDPTGDPARDASDPTVFDPTACTLGEGALWHPLRHQLYWFDVEDRRLLTREGVAKVGSRVGSKIDTGGTGGHTGSWRFSAMVSAAGWLDATRLIVASDMALLVVDITDGTRGTLLPLESHDPRTRSNDGRADPWGGFWISTMGKAAEPDLGAIYRYYDGQVQHLRGGLTIPNSISFAPDRSCVYFADTARHIVWRQALHPAHGWPEGELRAFADFSATGEYPDGAVTDAAGNLWVALWGSGALVCIDPQGRTQRRVALPARQISCPAFGGAGFGTLFVTSARKGLDARAMAADPLAGQTFAVEMVGAAGGGVTGRAEPRVLL